MSNPSTDEELRQFLRQRISGISTAAENDILAVINREKAALHQYTALIEQELINEVGYPKFRAIKDAIEARSAKLTKEDK